MKIRQLNPSSPMPLYRQLADILLENIRSGSLAPGEKIPSETYLAEELKIGRPTVRQATELLIRKGILERKRGSGTFIKEHYEEVDLFSIGGTSSAFSKKGIHAETKLIKEIIVHKETINKKNPFLNKECFFFSRLININKEPLIIEDFYIDNEVFYGIEKYDLKNNSLKNIVEDKYFLKPVSGKQNFKIGYAETEKASVLKISINSPILIVERFLNFPNADNGIFSVIYCKTDKFVFSQTIGGLYE
jgi:GntR family transcriptional regulator